jgi:SAM-dependent methyltransferase
MRLAAIARAGFYPTPPRVTAAIARALAPPPTGQVRLLDPCAGTGEAAATLGAHLRAETFGVELHAQRAQAARQRLHHLLQGDALQVRLAHGAWTLLFLNPPYDHDEAHGRLEHAFLLTLSRALAPGGLLVFLIPQRRLARSARFLSSHYHAIRLFRFPDPEYDAFRQVVLLGVKRPHAVADPDGAHRLAAAADAPLPPLPDDPGQPWYVVPPAPPGRPLFQPGTFQPELAAQLARARGAWANPLLADALWPATTHAVQPLMPLRRGHLALLAAAGLFNNLLLDGAGRRVLVKGRTTKRTIPVASDDPTEEREREILHTTITLLDLDTGALEAVVP